MRKVKATLAPLSAAGKPLLAAARKPLLAAAMIAMLAASGCGRGDSPPSVARRAAADARSRLAAAIGFRPPANGLLTEAHIDRFVKVRRAAKGRSDEEAARAVGLDPDELLWIRARVTEALLEADRRRVRASADEVYGKTIASLRETRKSVREAGVARTLDEQIAGLERERATLHKPESVPPALSANALRVAARRAEIDGAL